MCDSAVTVLPDRVLFAKNSDRDPNEAQILEWHPRRTHAAGATVRCTWITIPAVRQTFATVLSRPFWMWGAEMGANERGLVIGNHAVFTRERYAKEGLTGMDLVRLALERAGDATSAVEVLTGLLETHGQGGGCGHEHRSFTYHNSFLVADGSTAFVLETAGRQWSTREVRSSATLSNGLTLPGFAEAHSDRLKTAVSACRARRARTTELVGGVRDVAGMMRLLRDHGSGRQEPRYHLLNGGLDVPCVHAGGVVAASQTTASWVSELRPDGARHWATATAAPCTGLFKPVAVDTPVDTGPPPTDRFDGRSLWWRHEALHRCVLRSPPRVDRSLFEERDALERQWQTNDTTPATAFGRGDDFLERWTERLARDTFPDERPLWVRRYWAIRNRRAGIRP